MNKRFQPLDTEQDGSEARASENDSIVGARRGDADGEDVITSKILVVHDVEKVQDIFDDGEAAGNDVVVGGGHGAADGEMQKKLQRNEKS